MHRDYSDPGSYVAIVVFDHRIAVRSVGTLPLGPGPARDQVGTKSALSRHQVQVLELPRDPQAITDLLRLCGRSDRTKFRNQVLRPLLESGLVTMTIPDKPTSSRQRYLTTEAGKRALDELKAVSA
jgi:hypothetical protein